MGHDSLKKLPSVAIVVNTFGRGGAEMSLAVLANELAKSGRRVSYIALWSDTKSYNFGWLRDNGVRLHIVNDSKNAFVLFVRLLKLLSREKPEFIYSAMLYSNILSQVCAFLLRVTHIASVRTNPARFYEDSLFKRLSFALTMSMQNCIVFISHKAHEEYMASIYGKLIQHKHLFVLHNPVVSEHSADNLNLHNKFTEIKRKIKSLASANRAQESIDSVLNFVMVSRLVEGKGILETLEQIRIPFRRKGLHLSVYGAGPLERQIQQYISSEFTNNNVEMKGYCDDLTKVFSDADILIFPSRNEGFGRVPFEALLRGSLVLCNDGVSIINEFLRNPMVWINYKEPMDIINCIEQFAHLEPLQCVAEVNRLSIALSPHVHASEFNRIANICSQK